MYGNSAADWEQYGKDRYSAGQIVQSGWNILSNPLAQIGLSPGKDNLAGGQGQGASMFTNPLGLDFTGGAGGWNESLSKDKEVFMSMSEGDWQSFSKMTTAQQNRWVQQRHKDLVKQRQADEEEALQKKKEADFQKWREDTMKRLDTFSQEMNMPVEELIRRGDLGVTNAGNTASAQARQAAYGAGMGPRGLSLANSQRAVTDAQAKYQLQRAQLGSQATQGLLGAMSGMSMEQSAQRQYEQNMNLQLQQAQAAALQQQYLQKQQQASGMMGIAGGVIGGYFGGAAGAQAGYQVGSGLGSYQYGSQNPYQPYQYSYPRGTSQPGSGGLSTTSKYGGSQ